jgi:hypothetical protein
MAGKGKQRVAKQGVKVSAVSTTSGPPSTTVHVELDRDQLKREVGEFEAVERVEASIPTQVGGAVRWERERMSGMAPSPAGAPRGNVERYFGVHYGPTESKPLGVGVTIQTDAGTVRAQSGRESYSVEDPDRPGASERRRKPR